MEKRSVVIYVAGQRFALSTEDSEEYVIGVGEKVDGMIRDINKANPRLNRDGSATLCALSICDDMEKLRTKIDTLTEQMKAYLRDADFLREENESLKKEIEKLRAEKAQVSPAKEETVTSSPAIPAPIHKPEEQKRQLAFTGKDFRGEKKKRHNHEEKRNRANRPWTQGQAEKKPLAVEVPAADIDEKGLPEEPPLQYSIFDTDFI